MALATSVAAFVLTASRWCFAQFQQRCFCALPQLKQAHISFTIEPTAFRAADSM
jgi:hypothetical protein